MELLGQSRLRLQKLNFTTPYGLRFIFALAISSMVVVSSALSLTRFMPPPPNPFVAYAPLIADGSSETEFWSNDETLFRAAFNLACKSSLIERYCVYRSSGGPFAEIRFMELDDEGKKGIYFAMRDNAVTVGDLAHLWGRPTIVRHHNSLVLHWPVQHVSSVVWSDNGQFDYFLPVPYLLVEGLNRI